MAVSCVSCIVLEIKRDIGRKSRFIHTHLHSTPPLRGSRRNINIPFGTENLNGRLPDGEKRFRICVTVLTEYQRWL